ncbi:MAG: DUF6785 family protein [Armatimonadota bacterium]
MAVSIAAEDPERGALAEADVAHGLSVRALVLSAALLAGSLYWVRQAELVSQPCQITESVPPIPAVAGLILLAIIAPLLRRLPAFMRLSRADILIVYAFLTIATPMASVGVVRLFFPCVTALYYFADPDNDFALLGSYLPSWGTVRDTEAIRTLYEGSVDESVPWLAWAGPLAIWSIFFLAVFIAMLGIMVIFRRQWVEKEHLGFPIVQLVLNVAEAGPGRTAMFFRNSTMWVGFGLAFVYNLLNMLNAFNPAVPALGKRFDMGALFTERPMDAIRPLVIQYRPAILGFGYLVSLEVAFSVWVFYLLTRLENVLAVVLGYEISGMPFDREQSSGGYLALAIFLVWVARGSLRDVLRKAFLSDPNVDDSGEPMSYRAATLCAILGFGTVVGFAVKAGMWLSTSLLYFGIIFGFMLVYSRIRAEAGAPMVWLFPYYEHKRMILNAFGSKPFTAGGDWSNLTLFSTFMFMSRGYYQSSQASVAEALKIADDAQIRRRSMALVLVIAAVLGIAGAYYMHLQVYYQYGNNVLEGGTTSGGYRTRLALTEFTETEGYLRAHKPPDYQRTGAVGFGFFMVTALVILRSFVLKFPLHPLGFIMSTAYGSPTWAMFFLVWLTKSIALKVGGMRLYRRLIPFFLGIALGHFFTAGIVWGAIGSIGEMYRRYVVHFG